MMNAAAEPTAAVWLRGNVRPVLGLAAVAAAFGGLIVAIVLATGTMATHGWLVAVYWLVAALVVGALSLVASRPRLEHTDGMLRVRLAPGRADDVPLAVVECFFLGSNTLGPDDAATHRVGTLVMRIAERATEWQQRPTFAPWGTWADGAVVFDGRWCEPLSLELARGLSGRLVEVKRAVATGSAGPGA